jgi:hypothetical protein
MTADSINKIRIFLWQISVKQTGSSSIISDFMWESPNRISTVTPAILIYNFLLPTVSLGMYKDSSIIRTSVVFIHIHSASLFSIIQTSDATQFRLLTASINKVEINQYNLKHNLLILSLMFGVRESSFHHFINE